MLPSTIGRRGRNTVSVSRKSKLRKYRKVKRSFVKKRAKTMLDLFTQQDLDELYYICEGEDGTLYKEGELEFWNPSKMKFHTKIVNAASLKNHVMYPREHPRPSTTLDWYAAREKFMVWLRMLGSTFNLPAHEISGFPATHVVGYVPATQDVRWQGTHPCCCTSILAFGARPKQCLRRGAQRKYMLKKCFHAASYLAASRWSQFVDIGYLRPDNDYSKCEPSDRTGWVANAILIIPDFNRKLAYSGKQYTSKTLYPTGIYFELRSEEELWSCGRKMSPHAGVFY